MATMAESLRPCVASFTSCLRPVVLFARQGQVQPLQHI